MHAGYSFHLFKLLNLFTANRNAFFCLLLFFDPLKTIDHPVRHIHAGNVLFHISRHTKCFHGSDSGKYVNLFGKTHIVSLLYPLSEAFHVIDALGLNEIGTCLYFLGKPIDPELIWFPERVCSRADKHAGRLGKFFPVEKLPFVSHLLDHIDKLYGVDIKNLLAFGVVTKHLVIAGKTEYVSDPQCIGTKNI